MFLKLAFRTIQINFAQNELHIFANFRYFFLFSCNHNTLEKLPKFPRGRHDNVSKIIFPDCSNAITVGLVVVVDVTIVEVLITSVRSRILSRRPIVNCCERRFTADSQAHNINFFECMGWCSTLSLDFSNGRGAIYMSRWMQP
jgi:hypothetical protein